MSLFTVKCILLLDGEGKRIISKYYSKALFPTKQQQLTFEKNLFSKTNRTNGEIILFENLIVVYKSNVDVHFFVVGDQEENELMLSSVLNAFFDAVTQLLRGAVDRRSILDNLDTVLLSLDEIIEDGIILEADHTLVVGRVQMKGDDAPEQSIQQAINNVADRFKNSLLR